jgi:hypothetical protein
MTDEHSVILTLPAVVLDDAQTPDQRCRYTWHNAGLTYHSVVEYTSQLTYLRKPKSLKLSFRLATVYKTVVFGTVG